MGDPRRRKCPKISEVLPLLYVHGQQWQADRAVFLTATSRRSTARARTGIHLNVRLEEAKACVLVLVGGHDEDLRGGVHADAEYDRQRVRGR
ncbi:hypothetical protein ACIHCQ_19170 [Streptomyces sp. NPDC052236]|uniref:hypothetical protein n=1 Tax=Streptomyces sp. NPDC052236 TaxID=3365686 RepID=UPI0037D19461